MLWDPPSVHPNLVVTNHIYDPKRGVACTNTSLINVPYIRVSAPSRTRIHDIQYYPLWGFQRLATTSRNSSYMTMGRGPMYFNNATLVRGRI